MPTEMFTTYIRSMGPHYWCCAHKKTELFLKLPLTYAATASTVSLSGSMVMKMGITWSSFLTLLSIENIPANVYIFYTT